MSKIIVTGVDASQTAQKAADRAAELAVALNATLHVYTAYSVGSGDTVHSVNSREMGKSKSEAYQNLTSGQAQAAQLIAEAVANLLRENNPTLSVEAHAVEGSPASVLVGAAKELDADIIVVGNKHVQGLSRFLGSVARRVASEAPCDLHVVNTTHH